MTPRQLRILQGILKPKLFVLRVLWALGGLRMGRDRVIEQLLLEDIQKELSGSTALRLTLSDTDQPLSILIEEKGRPPETRRIDGYLDLAVLMAFQLAYRQDRYEYVRPDYYEAALRAKSEQDFRDIYKDIKRESWLQDVRDMIVSSVIDLEGFRLAGNTLNIISNMLFGDFKRASEQAFVSQPGLVERCKLLGIDLELYLQEVLESLVPLVRRVINYKCPAIYVLLNYCDSQVDFKCLCRSELGFLRHKMHEFTEVEMETVLSLELGL